MPGQPGDTTAPWPLVDRDAALTRVGTLVAHGRGVLVTGPPGTGRTRLLREALARLRPADTVTGHRELSALLGQYGVSPRLLAVDDVHALDGASAGRLAALVCRGRVQLLATAPSGTPLPEPLAALCGEGAVRTVETAPFDLGGTARAMRARLGSQVATDTAARLYELTGGNPLLLTELVEASALDGTLRPARGLWQWRGPAERPAARVAEAVRRLLGPLDDEERELTALLALGGPLPDDLPPLARLADAAARLKRRRVVVAEPVGHGTRLRLGQPLCGQFVLAELAPRTAHALRLRLADALEASCGPHPAGAAGLLTTALRVDAGRTPHPDRLRTAAEAALTRYDFATAERYARLAIGDPPRPQKARTAARTPRPVRTAQDRTGRKPDAASALLLGRALSGQARGADAEAVFAALDVHCPDVLAARVRNLAWGLRRADAAAALAERLPGGPGHALRAAVALLRDRLAEAADAGEAALREPSAASAALSCVPVAAFARAETDGSTAALALLRRCGRLEGRREDDRHTHLAVGAHIAVDAGDDHGARLHLDRMRRTDAPDDTCRRLRADVTEARLHRARGRMPEAVALLRRAAAVRDGQDWFTTRPWTLAQLAGALAEGGDTTEAVRTLIEVRLAARHAPRYPLADDAVALEEALVLGRAGDVPGALRRADEVARRAAAAGRNATALSALHLTARLGRPAAAAERLAGLAPVACPLGELRAEHIRALAGGDAARLDHLADRFAAHGRFPLAAEAASQAHRLWRDAGRHRPARSSLAACRDHLALTRGAALPGWAALPGPAAPEDRPGLTPREHEVAVLAASGLKNTEIARRLTVSVRTVENHLHRVYGKLGVTSRSGLNAHVEAGARDAQLVGE